MYLFFGCAGLVGARHKNSCPHRAHILEKEDNKTEKRRELPGCPVVSTPPLHCPEPRTKIPQALHCGQKKKDGEKECNCPRPRLGMGNGIGQRSQVSKRVVREGLRENDLRGSSEELTDESCGYVDTPGKNTPGRYNGKCEGLKKGPCLLF